MGNKNTKKAPLAQRVKSDPRLLARALKDPGLRSQLPDRYLDKTQLAARSRRQFIDDLGNIDSPLSGASMVNVADRVTDRQYRPQYDALDAAEKNAIAQRDQQQQWAKGTYASLNGILGNLTSSQVQANATALGDTDTRKTATLNAIDAAGQDVTKRAADDASVRGAGLGQDVVAQDLATQQAAAKDRASNAAQAASTSVQVNGDANAALLRGIQAAAAQRGGEVQGQISSATRGTLSDLDAQRKELAQNEGDDRVKNLTDLRKGEVDRLLTEKGISSDLTQAQMDADLKATEIKSNADLQREKMKYQARLEQMGYDHDDAKQAADQQFQAQQNALDRKNRTDVANIGAADSPGDKPEFTNSEKHANMKMATDAIGAGSSLKRGGQDRQTALQFLTDKYGDIYARIAVNLAYDGGKAQKHLRQELLQLGGIHLPDKYIRK